MPGMMSISDRLSDKTNFLLNLSSWKTFESLGFVFMVISALGIALFIIGIIEGLMREPNLLASSTTFYMLSCHAYKLT